MDKNNKSILLIITVTIIAVLLLIINKRDNNKATKIYCDFFNIYDNYKASLTFTYDNGKLSEFRRNEVFTEGKNKTLKEIYEGMKALTDEHENNEYYTYDTTLVGDEVHIDTFINVKKTSTGFDKYAQELGVKKDMKPEEIKKNLELTEYVCRIE